jgi:transcriptional regulator with XRE-family HTH domain
MAWKEMTVDELANSLGVNPAEVREKQRLIELIVKARKARKFSQSTLAKKMGVTQGRIAQIESGIGTAQVSFDVLLNILTQLGYDFTITPKKVAGL